MSATVVGDPRVRRYEGSNPVELTNFTCSSWDGQAPTNILRVRVDRDKLTNAQGEGDLAEVMALLRHIDNGNYIDWEMIMLWW